MPYTTMNCGKQNTKRSILSFEENFSMRLNLSKSSGTFLSPSEAQYKRSFHFSCIIVGMMNDISYIKLSVTNINYAV